MIETGYVVHWNRAGNFGVVLSEDGKRIRFDFGTGRIVISGPEPFIFTNIPIDRIPESGDAIMFRSYDFVIKGRPTVVIENWGFVDDWLTSLHTEDSLEAYRLVYYLNGDVKQIWQGDKRETVSELFPIESSPKWIHQWVNLLLTEDFIPGFKLQFEQWNGLHWEETKDIRMRRTPFKVVEV